VNGWSIASLDAPLSDNSSLTLIDVLPAPTPDVSVPSRRTRALNGAMRRLVSSRQRAALRRRYGLPGYGKHTLKETTRSLRTTLPTVDNASRRGLRKLANDARLCKVMGVEVVR
jgi:DNA-directed RNA polymerase sigma subunit (sigma70/sigma32)